MLYWETYNEYNETWTPDEYTKVYTVVTPWYWVTDPTVSFQEKFPDLMWTYDWDGQTVVWSDMDNARYNDWDYATGTWWSSGWAKKTKWLLAYNYWFTLPSTALIDWVELKVYRKSAWLGTSISDNLVTLTTNWTVIGTNKAVWTEWWDFSSPRTLVTYWWPTDTWGLSLTQAIVNSTNFGAIFSANVYGGFSNASIAIVDYMELKVYYKLAPTRVPPVLS